MFLDDPTTYTDKEEFADLPRVKISRKGFISVAKSNGWKDGVAELLLRDGYPRPIKCGEAIYDVVE